MKFLNLQFNEYGKQKKVAIAKYLNSYVCNWYECKKMNNNSEENFPTMSSRRNYYQRIIYIYTHILCTCIVVN